MKKIYNLALLETHPIPYRIPIYNELDKSDKINLNVYFCSDFSLRKVYNKVFNKKTKWLKKKELKFNHQFLKNYYPLIKSNIPKSLWNFGLINELIKNKPDAIIIYGYQSTIHKISLVAAKFLGIPIIFREEIDFIDESSFINKKIKKIIFPFLFKLPSAFLCSYTRNMEFYKYNGVLEEKLFMHSCSVDNYFFQNQAKILRLRRIELKKQFNISTKTKVISYIGRLTDRKRPLDTLRAYKKIKNKNKYSLIFVGGGILKKEIEEYVKQNNLRNVHVIDFIKYENISSIYVITDLFVIPSSYDPSPKTINEAMNFSIPIIASENIGTAQDLIKDGKNGYIIKLGDIENLASKMEKIISNSNLQNKMGKESLKIVSKWNIKENVSATIEALDYIYKNE